MANTSPISADEALLLLKQGNERFVKGESIRPRQDFRRIREVAANQFPFATIVGCSDSRVPNEIVFDQGLGDLFIIRTAGQVGTDASWGSIEFSVEVLHSKLVVVLGHTECGAVKASVEQMPVEGHMTSLVNAIKPAVEQAKKQNPPDLLDAAIRENIAMQVRLLRSLEPILARRVKEGSVKIIGALYDLNSGQIDFFS